MARVLLGVSGGIAAYKACEVCRRLVKSGHDVVPLVTPGAERFVAAETLPQTHEQRFVLDLKPELCGRLDYRIRIYPRHALLTHPFELGLMRWL